ncbi:MAG: hypothetical protein ABIT71_16360 [Vicinamibacteraceae bacterium]
MVHLGVFLLYTLLSVVFTWPLATDLAELAPAHFDPPFTAWRLGWLAHQFAHPSRVLDGQLFDGNIFWPDRNTLAYSDAVLLQGLIATPLVALGAGPNGIANALSLVGIVTSAFFAYLLAARLSGSRRAAIVAGLVFAFSTYRRVHLQHLELQWAQWMPLAFWAWHRLLDTGRMRDGLLCAGLVLLQLLSSLYYAMFLAIGLAVVGLVTLIARRGRIAVPALIGLTGGAVIGAGVAATYAQPYAEARAKVGDRSLGETRRYSATLGSFVTVSPDSLIYRDILPHEGEGETELFTGFTPVVLAGAALVPPATATAVAYGLSLLVAGDMALGTNGLTFTLMREHVSALRALRAPGRLGILVQLTLGVLASLGLARAIRRWPGIGSALTAASIGLVLLEYANGPLDVQRLPVKPSPVHQWLAAQPKLVTLELPVPLPHALPLHDPFYMYASTWHWQPLVNGYSGHYSERYIELLKALRTLPSAQSTRALTEMGVQRIIVHEGLFPPKAYVQVVAALEGNALFHLEAVSADHWGEARIYAFLPGFGR